MLPSVDQMEHVPFSRFRRELNSWCRRVNEGNPIAVTLNGEVVRIFMGEQLYKELCDLKEALDVSRD